MTLCSTLLIMNEAYATQQHILGSKTSIKTLKLQAGLMVMTLKMSTLTVQSLFSHKLLNQCKACLYLFKNISHCDLKFSTKRQQYCCQFVQF